MEIRQLNPNDSEIYKILRLEALKNNPEAFSSSFEEEENDSLEKYELRFKGINSFTYGAFKQNQLVGTVTLVLETKKKVLHRATIVAMYVTPEARGLGVGKSLMLQAIQKAKEMNHVNQVYLVVTATNEPAKALYTALGFRTYGIDKEALKIGDTFFDDELMVLNLNKKA
ncbi:GNAT family N-acetyltransferase [Litchfieldia alkalitelluris]|uniref:GNAT family N-acetyltransferase n=1 Tax=Litchfieldia alkalitelluris TaxID=304268 RepID=UPI000997E0A5|nr:GNAT family N-acetyltransferase [Litchfieldia alkalitelluris]